MRKIQIMAVCLLVAVIFASCGIVPSTEAPENEGIVLPQADTEKDSALPETKEELDVLFEALANDDAGSQNTLAQLQEAHKEELLSYLMLSFMDGELETASYQENSAAMAKYRVWYQMLGGEMIALETETPQEYWEEWCDLGSRIYQANGADFFEQENYPVSKCYIDLWLEHGREEQKAEAEVESCLE